jgi:hypothetical protein
MKHIEKGGSHKKLHRNTVALGDGLRQIPTVAFNGFWLLGLAEQVEAKICRRMMIEEAQET